MIQVSFPRGISNDRFEKSVRSGIFRFRSVTFKIESIVVLLSDYFSIFRLQPIEIVLSFWQCLRYLDNRDVVFFAEIYDVFDGRAVALNIIHEKGDFFSLDFILQILDVRI